MVGEAVCIVDNATVDTTGSKVDTVFAPLVVNCCKVSVIILYNDCEELVGCIIVVCLVDTDDKSTVRGDEEVVDTWSMSV